MNLVLKNLQIGVLEDTATGISRMKVDPTSPLELNLGNTLNLGQSYQDTPNSINNDIETSKTNDGLPLLASIDDDLTEQKIAGILVTIAGIINDETQTVDSSSLLSSELAVETNMPELTSENEDLNAQPSIQAGDFGMISSDYSTKTEFSETRTEHIDTQTQLPDTEMLDQMPGSMTSIDYMPTTLSIFPSLPSNQPDDDIESLISATLISTHPSSIDFGRELVELLPTSLMDISASESTVSHSSPTSYLGQANPSQSAGSNPPAVTFDSPAELPQPPSTPAPANTPSPVDAPAQPAQPVQPVQPAQPVLPMQPVQPAQPGNPPAANPSSSMPPNAPGSGNHPPSRSGPGAGSSTPAPGKAGSSNAGSNRPGQGSGGNYAGPTAGTSGHAGAEDLGAIGQIGVFQSSATSHHLVLGSIWMWIATLLIVWLTMRYRQ